MSGYVESLTDPSYAGQILTFAYPLIGNYGVNSFWRESIKIHPTGIVAAEVEKYPDHRKNQISLILYLKKIMLAVS
jgi:carbamoyl-phosphate synthase small subunit